jgi:hypothetical protein
MYKKRWYAWIVLILTLTLLIALFCFVTMWVAFGSDANVMLQVSSQRMRVERMTKDALVLADKPTALQRAQAESEIQDTFAPWQEVQIGLVAGDASIGLPQHPPDTIVAEANQSNADYTPMVVALGNIAAHPQHVDPVQLQIVLSHELSYFTTMSQVTTLWQQHIDSVFQQLFWIEAILIALIFVLVLVSFYVAYPKKVKE